MKNTIGAGARVIETNTFGANAVRLSRFGFENRVGEINKAAARIALEAAHGKMCVSREGSARSGVTAARTKAKYMR